MQIRDLAQLFVGQKVVQRQPPWVAGVARAEPQTGLAGDALARYLHRQIRRQADEFFGHLDNSHRRRRQPQPRPSFST
jgi:hypothetical protein